MSYAVYKINKCSIWHNQDRLGYIFIIYWLIAFTWRLQANLALKLSRFLNNLCGLLFLFDDGPTFTTSRLGLFRSNRLYLNIPHCRMLIFNMSVKRSIWSIGLTTSLCTNIIFQNVLVSTPMNFLHESISINKRIINVIASFWYYLLKLLGSRIFELG